MIYKKNITIMIKCEICDKKCKDHKSLGGHIGMAHKIKKEEYYVKYVKKEGEGKCKHPDCSNTIKFVSLKTGYEGYKGESCSPHEYCSVKCSSNDKIVREKADNTYLERYGNKNYRNLEQYKKTNLKKYGVENPSSSPIVKEIRKNSLLEKYGVENIFQTETVKNDIKQFMEDSGRWLKDEDSRNSYLKYRQVVVRRTNKLREELFENWDGYDYYDGEYIKSNLSLRSNDKNYPTIDHKLSVRYGFENGIDFKKIADMENLCITKRYLNNQKGYLSEEVFVNKKGLDI